MAAVTLRSKKRFNTGVETTIDGDMPNETGEEVDTAFPEPGVEEK